MTDDLLEPFEDDDADRAVQVLLAPWLILGYIPLEIVMDEETEYPIITGLGISGEAAKEWLWN